MNIIKRIKPEPDFNCLLQILNRQTAGRPVLFEFFMNEPLYKLLTEEEKIPEGSEDFRSRVRMIRAFRNAGYDYTTLLPPAEFTFAAHNDAGASPYSLNDKTDIHNRESFERHRWPDVDILDWAFIEELIPYIPDGMKLVASGPGGVEENVIALVGFQNLSYMMIDDPELVKDLFEAVGRRLVDYYREICKYEAVGACISNDDWGFKTQTFLSPEQMEDWLFPWHKKITETIHSSGRPVILHSCGNIYPVIDKIIDDLKYEGKHSYEDTIMPVEEAWETYHDRIAIMGGIDVDYMIRDSTDAIYKRSRLMLERTADNGAFALGTGNSVPEYLPAEKYFAMLKAAHDVTDGK